ncbi:hypothetical protein B5T_02280 [Alloalcanivorax dieselolei B5]|uniref:FixH family protein n=1 Tax=Alcanivorax dieselolei (strain DSM 16502 / CGMCC 1.3690 / MCCC 1A00001 / B-5) TaxID=930169 RepID=K0CAG1_ALCDB|nr:FixH family protein [Alloalcanivorax dieselolei]AFT70554.1 hypothetical protein B5T_02280 [Alloalcanivorax dieselolei B5]GGJ85213.1 hypothetical protein GCM10007426_12890 [Alloalcanivorax dieselolei]
MNHASSLRDGTLPWYRYPLVWLVILIPLSSVVGGMVTLTLAIRHADATVADDWYQQGKAINRSMADLDQARRLGLELRLYAGEPAGLRLTSKVPMPWPERLQLAFRHPTFAERDIAMTFLHQGGGRYRADGGALAVNDHWVVTVTPEQGHWRLRQRLQPQQGAP